MSAFRFDATGEQMEVAYGGEEKFGKGIYIIGRGKKGAAPRPFVRMSRLGNKLRWQSC